MDRIAEATPSDIADKEDLRPEDEELELKARMHHDGQEGPAFSGKAGQPKTAAAKPVLKCVPCDDIIFDTMRELLDHAKVCNSNKAPNLAVTPQLDYEWLRTMHRQGVAALRVPTTSQKAFMNLWNDFNLHAEHMLVTAARDPYKRLHEFVIKNRQAIIDRHLGVEFLVHARRFHVYGYITTTQWHALLEMFTSGKFD